MKPEFKQSFIHPDMKLEASDYKSKNEHTVVINTQALEDYIYVHLPVDCIHLDLLKMKQMRKTADIDSSDEMELMPEDDILKEADHPWVKIKSSILDWTPGKHLYKLSFGMPYELNPEYVDYYISYVSQEDLPDKPYVYMKR